MPAYSCALNNPLYYTDPTGLVTGEEWAQCYSDCVKETLLSTPDIPATTAIALIAEDDMCQTAIGNLAWWIGQQQTLELAGSATRIAAETGGGAAFGAVVSESACAIYCATLTSYSR
jgi:hypothetical protein